MRIAGKPGASWISILAFSPANLNLTAAQTSTDSFPIGAPEVVIPERFRPDAAAAATSAGAAEVYFTPQDENTSATVLFVYNTSSVSATVNLQTYSVEGTTYLTTSFTVGPYDLVCICSDTLESYTGSWADTLLVNFTTSSAYAKMSLPAGVKADGYVVWNNATTYNYFVPAPTLPLRFSSDPATVLLPTILKE
jgi:hypothetical protein